MRCDGKSRSFQERREPGSQTQVVSGVLDKEVQIGSGCAGLPLSKQGGVGVVVLEPSGRAAGVLDDRRFRTDGQRKATSVNPGAGR